jgi:hypothetical protein
MNTERQRQSLAGRRVPTPLRFVSDGDVAMCDFTTFQGKADDSR